MPRLGISLTKIATALLLSVTVAVAPAGAWTVLIDYPTHWRVQDYGDGKLSIFFTGVPCAQGWLILPAAVPDDTKNRLWALLLSAKAASKKVGIVWDMVGDQCQIISFFMPDE